MLRLRCVLRFASALRHRCVIFVSISSSPASLASYSSFSNLSLKSIAAVFGSLTKARVEFVLLELCIQTAKRVVLALETSRTFFAWLYDYPLQRIGSQVSLRVTRVTHWVEASVSGRRD